MRLRYPLAALALALAIWHILSHYTLSSATCFTLVGLGAVVCTALLDRWTNHLTKNFGRPAYTDEQLDAMTTDDILIR